MQPGAVFPGHALVGGELDQHMAEPEAGPGAASDQLPPLERLEVPLDERVCVLGEQGRQGVAAEVGSNDRRAAQDVALAGAQPVEAHRQQPVERGRDRVDGPVLQRRK